MLLAERIGYGQLGGDIITDTGSYTGEWVVVEAVGDTVIAELDSDLLTLNGQAGADRGDGQLVRFTGITLGNGRILRGIFTHIKLTSGSVIAYRTENGVVVTKTA